MHYQHVVDEGVCSSLMICRAVFTISYRYFPSGYVLAGDASIPYWAITDRELSLSSERVMPTEEIFLATTWTSATFNIPNANVTYSNSMLYDSISSSLLLIWSR
jgi:hypothetical protein